MKFIILIIIALAIYVLAEIYRETHSFVVTHYEVKASKLPKEIKEKTIVFLSDFHNQNYGEGSEPVLRAIREAKPDMILIGGDMLVGKFDASYAKALELVRELPKIAPVYYANGNHEQRLHKREERYGKVYWEYKEALEAAGIHFLVNDRLILEEGDQKIELVGMELPMDAYRRHMNYPLQVEEITERVGTAGENYTILLAHHPAFAKAYWKWGADLVLSGHLHGGVARIPLLGAAISPQFILFPKYSGDYYKEEDKGIIVSKGLGTHTINIRFWNRAEIIVFTLKGEKTWEYQ